MALKPVAQAAHKLKLATTAGEDWTVLWSYKSPWDIDSLAKRRAGAKPYLVNHLSGTIKGAIFDSMDPRAPLLRCW